MMPRPIRWLRRALPGIRAAAGRRPQSARQRLALLVMLLAVALGAAGGACFATRLPAASAASEDTAQFKPDASTL